MCTVACAECTTPSAEKMHASSEPLAELSDDHWLYINKSETEVRPPGRVEICKKSCDNQTLGILDL